MLAVMDDILMYLVQFGTILFEYVGVIILIVTLARAVYHYLKRNPQTRLILAKGLAMGLEFKLGSEILRTVVVRDLSEVVVVGAIILLRAALAFLIHWEIKNEREDINENELQSDGKA